MALVRGEGKRYNRRWARKDAKRYDRRGGRGKGVVK